MQDDESLQEILHNWLFFTKPSQVSIEIKEKERKYDVSLSKQILISCIDSNTTDFNFKIDK